MAIGILYLVCYFLDPFILSFDFKPLKIQNMRRFQEAITIIFIVNVLLTPFTAQPKKENILI